VFHTGDDRREAAKRFETVKQRETHEAVKHLKQ